MEDGKIDRTIQEKEKLDEWADILGIERPPIIFQGNLDDSQKEKILEFLRTPFEELLEEFKTKSFVRFIIGVLNPELKTTALNNDLDKAIEGIVFRFGDPSGGDPVLSKMVDPIFTEMARTKAQKRKEEKPSDFLGITILDVMNFILERGVGSFQVRGNSDDERYVSFVSSVFVEFLEKYGEKYRETDFQEPEYLKKEEFRVNKKFIQNKSVIKYIEEDESFESLFKLILNSFRKIKKRAGGIIGKGTLSQFNSLVEDIKERVEKVNESLIFESDLPTFMDFKRNNNKNKKVEYVTEESEEEKEDDPFYSYSDFISALETIDSSESPKKTLEESGDSKEELKDVNVLIGRFQPFHNGHLKMAKKMKEENDLPCIVAVVHPGHNSSGKSPFDEDLVKKYMEAVVRENGDSICGFFIVNRGLLGVIYGTAKTHGFNIKSIGAGDDRVSDYKKQIDYLKKNGKDFPQDITIVKTPRSTSATEVRKKIEEEDFTSFKKMVPPSISSLYNSLVTGMNSHVKTGEISSDK
jgi:cytidyltransferase-like protein